MIYKIFYISLHRKQNKIIYIKTIKKKHIITLQELNENVEVLNYRILHVFEDISKCEISAEKKLKYLDQFYEVFKSAFDMLREINADSEKEILNENC